MERRVRAESAGVCWKRVLRHNAQLAVPAEVRALRLPQGAIWLRTRRAAHAHASPFADRAPRGSSTARLSKALPQAESRVGGVSPHCSRAPPRERPSAFCGTRNWTLEVGGGVLRECSAGSLSPEFTPYLNMFAQAQHSISIASAFVRLAAHRLSATRLKWPSREMQTESTQD